MKLKSFTTLVAALSFATVLGSATPLFKPILAKDLKCLVDNVYHESRGEPFLGQVLVARTTINRGKDLCKIVYAPYQFSWTANRPKIKDKQAYQIAYQAAIQAFTYQAPVYYFHATYVKPRWAKTKQLITKEGNHVFYK